MADTHVPYETLARAEADDVLRNDPWFFDSLGIPESERWKLLELIAAEYAKGLEAGMTLSEFSGLDPISAAETYVAGYEQAVNDISKLGEQ